MLFDGKNFVVKSDEGTVDVVCGKVVLYARESGGGGGGGDAIWGQIIGTLSNQTDLQNALNAKANTSSLRDMAYVADAPSNGNEYVRKNGAWSVASGGGGGGDAVWGDISGTLSDQEDLQTVLDGKLNQDVIADEWMSSGTSSYAVGDLVIYQGALYQFTSPSVNPWSNADVDEITFTEWVPNTTYSAGAYLTHEGGYYRTKRIITFSEWPSSSEISTYFDVLTPTEFDPTQNYSVGDIVFHDGGTYVFLSAYTGGSGWDPTIVTEITVEELLAQKVGEAPINNNEYVRKNGGWVVSSGGGGGSAAWGDITGTLSDQTDLQSALNAKANTSSLGDLATQDTVNYSTQVTNKPTLGTMSAVDDAPSDSKSYARKNGAWSEVTGGVSSVAWGQITGTLASQTDLKTALDAKANTADLGDLASQDTVDYTTEVTNKPTLGTMSAVDDAPSNGSEYVRKNGAWAVASGGSVAWGGISGTLSDQTDLQSALNAKANSADMGGIQVRPNYIISDTDLTDGVSSLASGTLYLYYEV